MKDILDKLQKQSILILGFGKEGISTYRFIRRYFPLKKIAIADKNSKYTELDLLNGDKNLECFFGENYKENINSYDIIIKSPGISFFTEKIDLQYKNIASQTSLFIESYHKQIIGITGTKGKSTTTSLVYHIIKKANKKVLLVGNIGIPPFDIIEDIDKDTIIVYELSCHQLEYISVSPHIGIILNIFPEHLDHYKDFEEYKNAKYNIAFKQSENDFFIYNNLDKNTLQLINKKTPKSRMIPLSAKFEHKGVFVDDNKVFINDDYENKMICSSIANRKLIGEHNIGNILAAICATYLSGIQTDAIQEGVETFSGLEHRIEYVGNYHGINFYNDSIATIPEATIEALKALKNVYTLIIGGYDRGLDYKILIEFLQQYPISFVILTGDVGLRLQEELLKLPNLKYEFSYVKSFRDISNDIIKHTKKGTICLLSPAAASYNEFVNFEERGNVFKDIVKKL